MRALGSHASSDPQCAAVSLFEMLNDVEKATGSHFRIIAVDPNDARRAKMEKIAEAIQVPAERFVVADIPQAKQAMGEWTNGIGCNAILEVCACLREDSLVLTVP